MDEKPTYQELEKRIQELEKTLQKGKEKYRILLDESSDPFFSFYPDGKYRYVNQAFAEGIGKSVDEIVGHSIWDIYPGEEGDKRFSAVKHVFATGKPKTIEVRIPRPEGDQYYITTVKAVKDHHGKVIFVICSSKNITDRKLTEKTLRENEERFKYFTEASFEAIFFSEKGVCIEQNPAAEIMFGYTSKEAIGRLGTDWIAPESKDLVMNNMMKGVTEPYEAIAQKKDGSTFPARIHAKEMHYKGRIIRVTSLRDITDFKFLENDLRNREERFRLIAQSTNDIFYEWIVKTGELRWFGDIDTALGYQKGEIEHTLDAWLRVIHPEDRPSLDDAVKLHKNSTETINYVYRVLRKDGSLRYWHDHSLPILESDNKPGKWVGGISDITEQKQAEQEKAELEAKLNRAQKMESLGLLAGGVAHDLNNVLSGIVSYPELILLDLPEDSKFRKPIETMQASGNRAAAIVQDLLTVARGAATTKEPLKLNDLIRDYLDSPEFKKLERFHPTVAVNVSLDADLLNINGSPVHIRKVVMNLVSNASEAIEGSGNVTISTMNRYIDRPLRGYDDVKIGEYAVLSVSDVGSGISSADLERIFEPFYTKKVMGRSGTGLGLAVVWNVMHDHRGYIDVKSDENGTTFELYFPITRDEISDKDLSIPIKDYKGNGETILVVDDVESQREISSKMLDTLGYKAKAVSSGEEAVEYLKQNTVDLLLLDMIMDPGINGLETYERVIKIHPNQKAIIISGFAESDEVKEAQKLGAGRYIKKPVTLENIGLAVKKELEK
ncbi:MAG: PAS domain S-box protein [Deltaproteobacteria bacterium]|jgi:PAS domain S-box-containing protein|nr:PAS domain S-box protein [Deltaproteobacteria bacterium]